MEKKEFEYFGDTLRDFRQKARLTQRQLANLLEVHLRTVIFWESGDYVPETLGKVQTIAKVLRLNIEEEHLLIEARFGTLSILPLHHLPESNSYFTGREAILTELLTRLTHGKQRVQAISGMAGIGKTQIALEFAHRFRKYYHDILWVQADNREELETSYLLLARHLHLPEQDLHEQRNVVEAVKRWLCEHTRWLLILDNLEDLGLVEEFVPSPRQGSVILTTQRENTAPVAPHSIVLDTLLEEEGILFLLKRAERLSLNASLETASPHEKEAARAIVQAVGGLPLALDQAGAYIAETGNSLFGYLDLFKQERKRLLQRRGTVPTDHPESVTATFSLAFKQVHQKSVEALELLKLYAFLGADAIPIELTMQGAVHPEGTLEAGRSNSLQNDHNLEVLLAYSLVRRDRENTMLSIHRLVQTVLQDTFGETERRFWAERALLAVSDAFPKVEHKTWPQCERLLPHILLVAQHIEQLEIMNEEAGRLFSEAAIYLRDRSRYTEAESLLRRTLQGLERQLGSEHPGMIPPLNTLASLYVYQGKYEQAEALCKRTLQVYELQPGQSREDIPLHILATIHISRGKYEQAEPPLFRALQIRQQELGPQHLDVANTLNNLAALSMYQGKYKQAEAAFLQAQQIYEQRENPNLAYVLSNLGELYFEQGQYPEAELFFLQAQRICEQQLGLKHHGLAFPLNGLANLYREQGRYTEAEAFYQQSLRIFEQHVEPEHPDNAAPLHGLANLYREQGNYFEAERYYERALRILEQVLGLEQPETVKVIHDLARLQEARGDYEAARVSYVFAFEVRKKAFGVDHPKTIETYIRLVALLRATGQHEEAICLETAQNEHRIPEEEGEAHPKN